MRSRDPKPGVYWDAKGSIRLIVAKGGIRRWAMAYHRNGKSRSLGLGGDRTSLQEARDAMMEAR